MTGTDQQTEAVLHLDVLNMLKDLLVDSRRTLRGEACWTLSNVLAGNPSQIQRVMDAGLIPSLVDCAMCAETYVSKEAVWAISNATNGGTSEQIIELATNGRCIPALVKALQSHDQHNNRIVMVALEGLINFLTAGDVVEGERNELVPILRRCGGEQLLDDLTHHANSDVRVQAQEILTRFVQFFDMGVEGSQGKVPPAMWTPEEVKVARQREQAAREKMKKEGKLPEEKIGQAPANPKSTRRGSTFIPPQFYCPISQDVMMDPVTTHDGHTYERSYISKWFNGGNKTSPITGAALGSVVLVPNHSLRQMIEMYKPGYTHRADLDSDWACVACTIKNKCVDDICRMCGAEQPPRVPFVDPDGLSAYEMMGGGM